MYYPDLEASTNKNSALLMDYVNLHKFLETWK